MLIVICAECNDFHVFSAGLEFTKMSHIRSKINLTCEKSARVIGSSGTISMFI